MDTHIVSLVFRGAAGVLVLALLVHYWPTRAAGFANDNIYLTATLVLATVAIFVSDRLIEEEGAQIVAKSVGYLALVGLGLAAFAF